MNKKRIVFLVGLLLFSSFVLGVNEELIGKEKHMKLLAVQEEGGEFKGSIADLYLELNEGSGRVFLETFPLTKMDTQISTRFAKEIACNYFDLDCDEYDFIYTIKAESNIIGGPSAGAAVSALTAITLLNLEYDEKISITGTINSGGIIGPVGGVKEKLEAAAKNDLNKVLLAKSGGSLEENNETFNFVKYAKENLSLNAAEVENLNDVVFQFTGQKLKEEDVSLEISPDYQEIMKELSDLLCNRTGELKGELEKFDVDEEELEKIKEKENNSKNSIEKEDYYSAASFCFGANILIKELIYDKGEKTAGWIMHKMNDLRKKVELMERDLRNEEIETISDLQTMMVVRERLNEVKEKIEKFGEAEDKRYALAHAEERFFSAISWKSFFKMEGKVFVLDEDKLRESCMKKISESEERYQYVSLLFAGFGVGYIKEKIDIAAKSLDTEDHELCLMKAAQAKAEANAILSSMGLSDENFMSFWESKNRAVEEVIAENGGEGVFPILGYSYYQYANTLKETEKHSALLYLEYALEMSELDIYFEEEEEERVSIEEKFELSDEEGLMLVEGFILGFLAALLLFFGRRVIKGKKKKVSKPRQDPKALLGKKR